MTDADDYQEFPCGHKYHRVCGNGRGRDLCPYRCHQHPAPDQPEDPSNVNAAVEHDRQEIEELFN